MITGIFFVLCVCVFFLCFVAAANACMLAFMHARRFMKETYTPFLLSTKGKALVLLGSAALFAAGVYGVTQVRLLLTPLSDTRWPT